MMSMNLDYATAVGAFVLLPLIILANLYNREGGVMGYLWRENAFLARVGLVFLSLTWIGATAQLAARYGFLSADVDRLLATGLGLPMFMLSVTILVMSYMELMKFMRARWSV